jgi:hypothetical protein
MQILKGENRQKRTELNSKLFYSQFSTASWRGAKRRGDDAGLGGEKIKKM